MKVYCADTKKMISKLGAIKPKHGVKPRGMLISNLYSEKAATLFFTVISYIRISKGYQYWETVQGVLMISRGINMK